MPPNTLELIRFNRTDLENGLYGRLISTRKYLSQQVMESIQDPKAKIYKDSLLKFTMSSEEFSQSIISQDTGYSSCNGEMVIIQHEVEYSEIFSFRIRQVFWYNQKSKSFNARLLAYAPMISTYDNEGNFKETRALCWIKGQELPLKLFRKTEFNYIFQTRMLGNAMGVERAKVLKGNLDFRKLFAEELNSPTQTLIDPSEFKPISSKDLIARCYGIDTVSTYNYQTNQEEIRFENRNCIDQVENIRFVQNWFYDEHKKQLYTQLAGFAPLASIRDSEGSFRYFKPLFYQIYRKRKIIP